MLVARVGAVRLRHEPADRAADLLRVLGGGHLAGADRPHRLVGDHQPGHLVRVEAGQRAADLGKRVLHLAAFTPHVEALADAHDRGDVVGDRLARLRVDQCVVLVVVLRVARSARRPRSCSPSLASIAALTSPV